MWNKTSFVIRCSGLTVLYIVFVINFVLLVVFILCWSSLYLEWIEWMQEIYRPLFNLKLLRNYDIIQMVTIYFEFESVNVTGSLHHQMSSKLTILFLISTQLNYNQAHFIHLSNWTIHMISKFGHMICKYSVDVCFCCILLSC